MSKKNETNSESYRTKKPYTSTYRAELVVDFNADCLTSYEDILKDVARKLNVLVGVDATVNVFGEGSDMIIKVNVRGDE